MTGRTGWPSGRLPPALGGVVPGRFQAPKRNVDKVKEKRKRKEARKARKKARKRR